MTPIERKFKKWLLDHEYIITSEQTHGNVIWEQTIIDIIKKWRKHDTH